MAQPLVWGPTSRLGADNEDVFRRVAGLDDAELAALQEQGHWSLDYLQADGTPY